jgi:hypothetical protein
MALPASQSSPLNNSKGCHPAEIATPARNSAASRYGTRMPLQHYSSYTKGPPSLQHAQYLASYQYRKHSQKEEKINTANQSNLTLPIATIATPLPKPTTATGVYLELEVPSPNCTKSTSRQYKQCALPRISEQPPQ